MIKCISIDGADGSGKTTLVNALSKYYNVISVPRYYFGGMVPIDSDARREWFRRENAIKTTDIYISGQKVRYLLANEFKMGFHYKAINKNLQSLVVIDRGILSLKAFAFAALKKGTSFDTKEIDAYLESRFDQTFYDEVKGIIDYSFLLFKEDIVNTLCSRKKCDYDDECLVKYQQEYYEAHMVHIRDTTVISPLESKDCVLSIALSKLKDIEV